MIKTLVSPPAWATVCWLPAAEGGRKSGPPTVPVYAANCAFPLGDDAEVLPGWPATAELYSLLLQKLSDNADGSWFCALDFFARDLVANYVVQGAPMLIMEGPKLVGSALIERVDDSFLATSFDR